MMSDSRENGEDLPLRHLGLERPRRPKNHAKATVILADDEKVIHQPVKADDLFATPPSAAMENDNPSPRNSDAEEKTQPTSRAFPPTSSFALPGLAGVPLLRPRKEVGDQISSSNGPAAMPMLRKSQYSIDKPPLEVPAQTPWMAQLNLRKVIPPPDKRTPSTAVPPDDEKPDSSLQAEIDEQEGGHVRPGIVSNNIFLMNEKNKVRASSWIKRDEPGSPQLFSRSLSKPTTPPKTTETPFVADQSRTGIRKTSVPERKPATDPSTSAEVTPRPPSSSSSSTSSVSSSSDEPAADQKQTQSPENKAEEKRTEKVADKDPTQVIAPTLTVEKTPQAEVAAPDEKTPPASIKGQSLPVVVKPPTERDRSSSSSSSESESSSENPKKETASNLGTDRNRPLPSLASSGTPKSSPAAKAANPSSKTSSFVEGIETTMSSEPSVSKVPPEFSSNEQEDESSSSGHEAPKTSFGVKQQKLRKKNSSDGDSSSSEPTKTKKQPPSVPTNRPYNVPVSPMMTESLMKLPTRVEPQPPKCSQPNPDYDAVGPKLSASSDHPVYSGNQDLKSDLSVDSENQSGRCGASEATTPNFYTGYPWSNCTIPEANRSQKRIKRFFHIHKKHSSVSKRAPSVDELERKLQRRPAGNSMPDLGEIEPRRRFLDIFKRRRTQVTFDKDSHMQQSRDISKVESDGIYATVDPAPESAPAKTAPTLPPKKGSAVGEAPNREPENAAKPQKEALRTPKPSSDQKPKKSRAKEDKMRRPKKQSLRRRNTSVNSSSSGSSGSSDDGDNAKAPDPGPTATESEKSKMGKHRNRSTRL